MNYIVPKVLNFGIFFILFFNVRPPSSLIPGFAYICTSEKECGDLVPLMQLLKQQGGTGHPEFIQA